MNALNVALVEGHLTRDPELSYTSGGTACCKFSLGSNRSFKKGDTYEKEVSYFDIVTWAKLAEACGNNLKKGRGVRVHGRMKQDRWEKDGSTHSRVLVVADTVEFFPVKKEGAGSEEENHE